MNNLYLPIICLFVCSSAYALGGKQLREDLVSGSPAEQQRAMVTLSSDGPVVLMADVIAKTDDKLAKGRAATALEQHLRKVSNRTADNLSAIEPLMESDDPNIVEAAARGIMHYKNNARARAALKKSIGKAKSDQTRVKLLHQAGPVYLPQVPSQSGAIVLV